MHPVQLTLRNLVQHKVLSSLTVANVAVGMLVVSIVLQLRQATDATIEQASRDYALLVGPPGSRMELVVNTLFSSGRSAGVLPFDRYLELASHPSTSQAVPLALGDRFRGFPVVATTAKALTSGRRSTPQGVLKAGRLFREDLSALHDASGVEAAEGGHSPVSGPREAVVGAVVADQLGVRVGDLIESTHGVSEVGLAHEKAPRWTVVGVAAPTRTARDRVVWINLDSFLALDEHHGSLASPADQPGISAVWLYPKGGVHKALLLGELGKRSDLVVADVAVEVASLYRVMGNAHLALLWVALLVVAVGMSSVALGVFGTVTMRRRELSLLRVLGASRAIVVAVVLGEAMLLSALGALVGLGLAHCAVALAPWLLPQAAQWGLVSAAPSAAEWQAVGALVLAGAVGGGLPARRAYRQDPVAGLTAVV